MKIDFKKSLGQNFFVNKTLAEKIVSIATETQPNTIIEIGPGSGSFTQLLYLIAKRLVCIEKDSDLIPQLKLQYPKAEIINEDFMNLKELPINKDERFIIYSSLPYNLAKRIIEKCFVMINTQRLNDKPIHLYFIIQKEVAQSYTAKAPETTAIATLASLFATVKIHFHIRPESFFPVPRVMSSFIEFNLKYHDELPLPLEIHEKFINFMRLCYRQPRKTLNNNLKPFLSEQQLLLTNRSDNITEILKMRPQQLSLENLIKLFYLINPTGDIQSESTTA